MEFLEGSVKQLSEKITQKNHRFTSELSLSARNEFDSFKYISLLYHEWKLIWNEFSFKFLSSVHLLLKKLALKAKELNNILGFDMHVLLSVMRIFWQRLCFHLVSDFELFWKFKQ